MKVTLVRSYRNEKGTIVFVYRVSGSKEQLAQFKEIQGEYFREDENGSPLWFTVRCIGNSGKLIITTNGNVVPDMSAYDQAASLAAQYGGNFGEALAKASAEALAGRGTTVPVTDSPVAKADPVMDTDTDADADEVPF